MKTFDEDHLHLRGEHVDPDTIDWHIEGSPPLTWRTLNAVIRILNNARITSTYVENTIGYPTDQSLLRDHLHLRGEH